MFAVHVPFCNGKCLIQVQIGKDKLNDPTPAIIFFWHLYGNTRFSGKPYTLSARFGPANEGPRHGEATNLTRKVKWCIIPPRY
jgi:hypothetical protein